MPTIKPTREKAHKLLKKYNKTESLLRHAYSVEAVMRYIAGILNEDIDKWGIVGLLHDLDYEMYPDEHCKKTKGILEHDQWPEEYIRAVISHGWGICNEVKPESLMEKYLYTIDELTGLVATTALVRPSKSILDTEVKSVKKKWKDKRFAAGVDRSLIENGAQMLEIEVSHAMDLTIQGMRTVAELIGLKGNISF